MNKDAILATIIGLVLGLTIAGAFIVGPGIIKTLPTLALPAISLPKKTPPEPLEPAASPEIFDVTITAPLPDTIEPKEEVTVSGNTAANAVVVIEGPMDEAVITANEQGSYIGVIAAKEGRNTIVVTSYSDGKQAARSIDIYYTKEDV